MAGYQEGGLAAAIGAPDEEEEETQVNQIQQLQAGQQGFDVEEFIGRYEETAEQSRQALRDAREKVLAREYDPRQMWLAAAAAFGKPTRTGQFGETLGNLAGALQPEFAARDEFGRAKEEQILSLDQALSGVDRGMLGSELKLRQLQESQRLSRQELDFKLQERRDKEMKQNLTHEAGMRKEFNTLLKDYEKVSDAYGRVQSAAKNPSAAGDLAMIFNFMKMLDPGSTVREGEFATAAATAGVPGRIVTLYNNMLRGERLNPEQRLDFLNQAVGLYGTAKEGAQLKADAYRALAIRNELDPEDITAVFDNAYNRFDAPSQKIMVNMPDGGSFEVSQSLVDAGDKKEIVRLYEEHKQKQGFAEGGKVKKKFQEGGTVNFDEIEDETLDLEEIGVEEEDIDIEQILQSLGGAAAGAAVGPLAISAEQRLAEMAQPQLTSGRPAERKIVEAMEMSGTDPATVMQDVRRGQRLGVPETPLDVGGRMTRVLGEKALIAGGPEAEQVLSELGERHEGSRARVEEQVSRRFKTPEYFATEDKLTERLYERARPAYEKAWSENPALDHPPFWKKMVDNKYGEQAVHMALDFMDDIEQEPIGKKNIAGWVERPSLKFLDQVKRGFDQLIRKEENMGATPLGRHLRGMRKTLVTWLDDPKNTTPAYSAARKQYKGDLEILEALDTGRKQYLRMPTEEAKRMLQGMPWAEKNALRAGVTQRLYEQLDTPTSDINAARKILGSPGVSDKLALLFDKPKDFEVFKAALRREMELFQEGKKTLGRAERGRTSRMTKELTSQDEFTPGAVLKTARAIRPVEWFMKFIDRKDFRLSATEADEIIKILNEGDNAELQKLEQRLTQVAASRKRKAAPIRKKGRAAAAGALLGGIGTFLMTGEDEEEEINMEEIGQLLEGQQ